MRLRVHDDGRWAVPLDNDNWYVFYIGEQAHGYILTEAQISAQSGWHEAVVLATTDADAQRLAQALSPRGDYVNIGDAHRALDRLVAGTEGEND